MAFPRYFLDSSTFLTVTRFSIRDRPYWFVALLSSGSRVLNVKHIMYTVLYFHSTRIWLRLQYSVCSKRTV